MSISRCGHRGVECPLDRVTLWIVVGFAVLQLLGTTWDVPSSFGWENDGIAPRDLFGGFALNLTPGSGHRYPLFHYVLVGIPSALVLVPAAVTAESWTFARLVDAVVRVPTMTWVSLVAKLWSVLMATVTVLVLGRMARRTASRSAERWTVAWAVTCLSFTYYGRVSNLDVPYLMWTVLALERLLDVAARGARSDYRWFALFAAASVATKDQAYAAYVLVCPLYLLILPRLRPDAFAAGAQHWRRVLEAAGVGALAFGVLGGGLLNPTGFVTRLALLTGPNAQGSRAYPGTLTGVLDNVRDIALHQARFWWPWPLVILAWLGVAWVVVGPSGTELRARMWRLLPFAAGVSSLCCFTLVVGRAEERFVLPLGLALSYYGGLACSELGMATLELAPAKLARAAALVPGIGLCTLLALGGARSGQLLLTQFGDSRREVEAWLARLPVGAVVETYGLLVYLPRFDAGPHAAYRLQRVDPTLPIDKRNPIPGATEVLEAYGGVQARRPDVLVIPERFAERFLRPPQDPSGFGEPGRRTAEPDAVRFFTEALSDRLDGYRITFVAAPRLPRWAVALGAEPVKIHGSTGERVWVLTRRGSDADAAAVAGPGS